MTAFGGQDDNDWWIVAGPHNGGTPARGTPVADGETIRLVHRATGLRLHSHNIPSPVSCQQEVSAFGGGDANDDWRVRYQQPGGTMRLVHVNTRNPLHSHNLDLPSWGGGQGEVTCYTTGRDKNGTRRVRMPTRMLM